MEAIMIGVGGMSLFAMGLAISYLREISGSLKSVSDRRQLVRLVQTNGQDLFVNPSQIVSIEPGDSLGLESNVRLPGRADCWRKVKGSPHFVVELLQG